MRNHFYYWLGNKIRELRSEKKISQSELAQKLNLSRSSIANIEAGRQKILAHQFVDLAKIFNVTLDNLSIGGNIENKIEDSSISEGSKKILKDVVSREFKGGKRG